MLSQPWVRFVDSWRDSSVDHHILVRAYILGCCIATAALHDAVWPYQLLVRAVAAGWLELVSRKTSKQDYVCHAAV